MPPHRRPRKSPGALPLTSQRDQYRALNHEGKCYGIVEPSVFGAPCLWILSDREITAWTQAQLGPIVAEYVATDGPE